MPRRNVEMIRHTPRRAIINRYRDMVSLDAMTSAL